MTAPDAGPASNAPPIHRTSGGTVTALLAGRELRRFRRQPVRIVAALLTPILLWTLFGAGFGAGFRPEGLSTGYAAFMLPGMLSLVAVFASIFGSISLIEDRTAGWLQAVLVSPAPRWSIAAGKAIGGALTAWFQAVLLLPAALVLDDRVGAGGLAAAAAALLLLCTAISALGIAFAWRCDTSASFHAVMNLVLMPMWLLSGAFFPVESSAGWLALLMQVNPLTWMTALVRNALVGDAYGLPLSISLAWTAIFLAVATAMVVRRPRR
ncbi:MAG: ABC transporter permease [Phycisphaeraceae bacterium]|nr:ABC transporter permease [Phycisphaeraceae bacterium]